MFHSQQNSSSGKKPGLLPIKQSTGAITRVRAHVAHTMLMQVDVPPPPLAKDKPCLDRYLRTRYLPTQIPFSALPCSAYLSAEDIKQIAEVFKSFSVLPDTLRSNVNRQNETNFTIHQRENLVDSSIPISDRDLLKNTPIPELSVHLEQRSCGSPVKSTSRGGMTSGNLGMERPLKGTLPDDLAISKEWLVELLIEAIARNYSNEQLKHLSLNRNYNVSLNSGTAGPFHHTGKFDSGGLDGIQGSLPFLPLGVIPTGMIPGDNTLSGMAASKDISTSIFIHKMRRFQQKQAVLTMVKRDLLRWIEPLQLTLDPDHNSGIHERCKDQVDKLHFFHQLVRSSHYQIEESAGLLSTSSSMPHNMLTGKGILAKSKKQVGEDARSPTQPMVFPRTSDPNYVGTYELTTPLCENPLLNYSNLPRSGADTIPPANLSSTNTPSRRSSVVTLEGSARLSKSSSAGPSYRTSNTSSCIAKELGGSTNSIQLELLPMLHQGNDFSVPRTVKELNVPIFVQDDDAIESENAVHLIYYGERPDGTTSQTFKNILTNSKLWEKFLLEWERKAEIESTLSESINCSSNGRPPSRRNNSRQHAVVCWRDFSNNLILPADCLPTDILTNSDAFTMNVNNISATGNDFSCGHFCSDRATSHVRGEVVYKRVLGMRLEDGAHGGGGRRDPGDCFTAGDDGMGNEDDDIDQESDSRRREIPWGQDQLRRRADRVPNGTTGTGRGFIAAANSAKGVASAAAAESEALAEELKGMHMQSADHVLVSTVHHRLVTSAKGGLLKLWDSDWGNFVGNLLNIGTSWVLHMQFLHKEQYLFIATSNAELTVVEFPSGAVLQKYRGCTTLVTALRTVVQPDLNGTKRFGLKPGECGPHRFTYRRGMTAKVFNSGLKESRQVKSETKHNAIPIEGFVSPTSVFLDPTTLICVFGTAEGTVGGFDLSQYLKSSSILASMDLNDAIPFFGKVRAHESNMPVMGLCYNHAFQYVVSCARDGSVSHIPLNAVSNTESAPNFIRSYQRQSDAPPSQYFFGDATSSITSNRHAQFVAFCLPARLVATVHCDRRILLWSMGRNSVELVHRLSQETYDIISVSFMPKDYLIAVLTADLVISIYDFKGFRPLSVIHVTKCNECNAEDVSLMAMRCPQDDADGCIAFFPGAKGRLVCALRGPLLFDRAENGSPEDPSAEDKTRALPTSSKSEESELNTETTTLKMQKSPTKIPTSPIHQENTNTRQPPRKNITHHSAIVGVLLRRVRRSSSTTGTEGGSNDNDTGSGRFEVHTFSADWWRVWDPFKGELLREVNLCAEIRKQLPMFHRPLVTVCEWSTDACTRIIAGSRGGQVITLDASTGAVNNVEELLVSQRPLFDNTRFVDRPYDARTSHRIFNKKLTGSTPTSAYNFSVSEALDTDKQTSTHPPILDVGSLFNLDATVVYHYGMHMIVCGSNRCVLRRYFTNDVDPSGEEQFISMSFHLPATARTTITACCIVRDTHICLGTMDTRLFFYRMVDGSEPYAEEPLRSDIGTGSKVGESEPEIGAVIGLFFLNSSNQNLFVIVLDTGVMHVYSYLTNRSVARFRLHRAHECRIRKVIYHNGDVQLLICGDSLGRVRVLDISAFKSGTIDFVSAMRERCVFQGAPEEVSSLAFFSLPTASTAKGQDLLVRHRSLPGATFRNDMNQRRRTFGGSIVARSGKDECQIDSASSQGLLALTNSHRLGSSVSSSSIKPILVDNRGFEGGGDNQDAFFVVVGAGDGNVRLFSLQKQYERARSLRRSSLRTSSQLDTGFVGTRRSSFVGPSFDTSSNIELNTTNSSVSPLINTPPIRDHESLNSRRCHYFTMNHAHIGTFGLNKWNGMKSDTFQRDFAHYKGVGSDAMLFPSKCSGSLSVVVAEGQDERFLDQLLIQAKKNIELNSNAASHTLQSAFSTEDRATGSLYVSRRKAFDYKKRAGRAKKKTLRPIVHQKPQVKVGKKVAATSLTPRRARQEQEQQPKNFHRRAVSQRELKLLELILPRKNLEMSFPASGSADDLPRNIFRRNTKRHSRSVVLHGNTTDWFLCRLRPQRRLKNKYERNALLKMYPVSWLRKIEVIPNTCKIQDYHADGSPRLIPAERAFNCRWDLLVLAYGDSSNKGSDANDDNPVNSDQMLSRDAFSECSKMSGIRTSQSSGVGVVNVIDCPSLSDAPRFGDNNELGSSVQRKTLFEPSDQVKSSFITDLENITPSKIANLEKLDDTPCLSITELPTLCLTNASNSIGEDQSTYSRIREFDVESNLIGAQPPSRTLFLEDLVEGSATPNNLGSSFSSLPRPMDSGTLGGRTLQHCDQNTSFRFAVGRRLSNTNKPVFVGERISPILGSPAASVSSSAEPMFHTPKSFSFNGISRAPAQSQTRDVPHKENALQAEIQAVLSDLSPSAVEQRYEQTILAHLAHQLDRVQPSGHAPGAFMSRVKQIWQQRSIEDASQTMILSISKPALRRRGINSQASISPTAKESRYSPSASSKFKGSPKKVTRQQCRPSLLCDPNHTVSQEDPGIGLNLSILTLSTDKKGSIVSGRAKHGTIASVSASAKDKTQNVDKTSAISAHELVYQKLESWRYNREQEVVERRRAVERLTGRVAGSKTSKSHSLMPNCLTRLPLLYAEQVLEPVNVPAPSLMPRCSEDAKNS